MSVDGSFNSRPLLSLLVRFGEELLDSLHFSADSSGIQVRMV